MREIRLSVATASLVGESLRTVIVTDLSTIAKAQRESREKDEVLAMLAHELRNPLGAIAGAIQVFNLVELADARAALARGVIERQVSHMARLIDDLLEVGRVVTGKIAIDHRPVDLSECVKSSVAAARAGQHADRNIELDVEPAWVMGDAVRLEQVASNLIANALRFTTSGQRVRVSVEADHGNAVLRVSDEGAGIEPDLLPRIFELFVQADRTRDRFKGGLGIGLTLVKRLVDLHGGIVAAASDGPGRGATFTVRLPRVAAPRDRLTTGAAAAAGSGLRVLLVDDNADARGMYALILKSDGHEVHQAADGISGLEVFRRTAPLVAVVDIGLPGMDGYEFARQLRAEPSGRDVRLIALTGYGFPEDRERSRAAGFDSHLVKPVTPDELRQQLSAVRDNVAR
jgi:CheY-like chemotaxis protein